MAAVADGVGSESLSHIGAQLAVESVLHRLAATAADAPDIGGSLLQARRVFGDIGSDELFLDVATTMRERAERDLTADQDLRALSTTLCVAAVSPPGRNGGRLATVWRIGDSAAFVLDEGRWQPVFEEIPETGLVSPATDALPLSTTGQRKEGQVSSTHPLFLMTDGVAFPLGDGTGEVGRYLAARWQQAPDPLAFLMHAQFHRKGFDDDRSVVGIWPE